METSEKPNTTITIDAFAETDLRVGKIIACERVEKSKKLLKCQVDMGDETRQVVAGLAQVYLCEEMVGRNVVIVANLAPVKLMGVESNGMMLAATGGQPVLVSVPEGTPPGSKVT